MSRSDPPASRRGERPRDGAEPERLSRLRARAEAALDAGRATLQGLDPEDSRDVAALVEELRVYQTELELQNQELLEATQRAERSERRHRGLFEGSPLPAMVVDRLGVIQDANEAARTLFGMRDGKLRSHALFRLLAERDDAALAGAFSVAHDRRDSHGSAKALVVFHTQVSAQHAFQVHVRATEGADGESTGYELQMVDMTATLAMERRCNELVRARTAELSLALEAAQAAQRARNDFLSKISHELRTPLTTILGFTDRVLRSELPSAQREPLQVVMRSAKALRELVDNLLDLTLADAHRLQMESATIDVANVVAKAVDMLMPEARSKGLALDVDLDPRLHRLELVGDETRLLQVLLSLLGNAIKSSGEGRVLLRARLDRHHASDEVVVRFLVIDPGIGIATQDPQRIVGASEQGDDASSRRDIGTGIGLALSRKLVQAMGGELFVHSEPGRGSRFGFTVRLRRSSDSARPAAVPDDAAARAFDAARPESTAGEPATAPATTRELAQSLAPLLARLEEGDPTAAGLLADLQSLASGVGGPAWTTLRRAIQLYDFDTAAGIVRQMLDADAP